MTPWLTTAPAPPALYQFCRPARKSRSLIERVVAKRLPTSTEALRAKRMPFGLLKKTEPLAVRRPKISDGLLPVTRFSAIAEELGWLKLTHALEPTEKLSQLRIALFVDWSICSLFGL